MAVTFDGNLKIININFGETLVDVKRDIYSAWKEWITVDDNSKFPVAISAIGGDPLPGGKFLGTTFFLENGWKIKPFEADHTLTVSGNLYSRDGSDPFVSTIGNYNIRVNLTTSNLVDTISTAGGTSVDPNDIAVAVWNRLAVASTGSGTFGEFVNMIKATVDNNNTRIIDLQDRMRELKDMITVMWKFHNNKTVINPTEKTLTIYDNDGTTPLKVFDLKDYLGNSSVTQIAQRNPR